MKLTDEQVEAFRDAYKKGYGEEMPADEARMWAVRLVRLYRILLTPTPRQRAEALAKTRAGGTLTETTPPVERRDSAPPLL